MSVRDIIKKIKTFLEEEQNDVQLVDVKTTDGTILSYDGELAVGIEIFIVDETGRIPATDGEYILEDGTKIGVVEGKVGELEAPEVVEEAPEEMPVEEMPVMAEEQQVETAVSLEDLVKKIKCLEDENLEIKAILSQLAESFSQETFKEEVKEEQKLSVVKEDKQPIKREKQNQKTNELNSIFRNMYK